MIQFVLLLTLLFIDLSGFYNVGKADDKNKINVTMFYLFVQTLVRFILAIWIPFILCGVVMMCINTVLGRKLWHTLLFVSLLMDVFCAGVIYFG